MGRCRVDVGWMWGRCRVVIVFPPSPPNVGSSWEFLEIENKKIKTVRNNSYG